MRRISGELLLSASDVMRFIGCRHATTLDRAYMDGHGPVPRADREDAELLQKHGDAHERNYLARLRDAGKKVLEINKGDLAVGAKETQEALQSGDADVIFQGAFLQDCWGGWSDFLEKVDKPSSLGGFSYEVTDTKLKRTPSPKHVLQLVLYSDLLTTIQGVQPGFAHIQLGDGRRHTIRLKEFSSYARAARKRLQAFVKDPTPTRPIPCSDCGLCRWGDHCADTWRGEDSLFEVANISRVQVTKLENAGIRTMEALASQQLPFPGISSTTAEKLIAQARLQQARKTGEPHYELRPQVQGKGFDLLPKPEPGDLFYDIEGDPHFEGGLEYLHGVWFDSEFKDFWAHGHQAEAQSLAALLQFFRDRLDRYPSARIYHYAPYEITALRRLTQKYGIGEAFLDRLMREGRFVDLYAVVRGALLASEANYSIKSLEVFYGVTRQGEVKTAGGSVVAYEKWRETGEQSILDEIRDYNQVDCESTEKLRDWLVSIRPELPWPNFEPQAADKEETDDAEAEALRSKLMVADLPPDRRDLLFNLAQFHKREAKPAWWAVFDSIGQDDEQLIEDLDALGGLVASGEAYSVARSMARDYRFPDQETKLREGSTATIPFNNGITNATIMTLDRAAGTVTLKLGKGKAEALTDRLSLHPNTPLDTKVIAAAIRDVIDNQCGSKKYRALDDLLSGVPPRMRDGRSIMLNGDRGIDGIIDAVAQMEDSVLPIQGPPGTGKTFVTARSILSLVKNGFRVGVSSNSHEAIRNVLMECARAAGASKPPRLVHKVSGNGDDGYPHDSPISRLTSNDINLGDYDVVGGTAFFFARSENAQQFDWLFVDEAGQVGLANMVAMGRAARNLVLVGDPQQLPQVIQGSHPSPLDLSCLEWMLQGHATVPAERGIFLNVTRRMHPEVCSFISEQVYEGRLENDPATERQRVGGTGFPNSGVWWMPVDHEGNTQSAREEAAAIHEACNELLRGIWTEKDGSSRPITGNDIIVVAPYNAQVNVLRSALPDDIRVGTVDKFQGQEAPICIVSMTASSAEDVSRGFDFLFSLNRINVAVSRAKGLALVFGSTRLIEATCNTTEQMRLLNSFSAIPLAAAPWGGRNYH
jgi:predicted RecB family nuclease